MYSRLPYKLENLHEQLGSLPHSPVVRHDTTGAPFNLQEIINRVLSYKLIKVAFNWISILKQQ